MLGCSGFVNETVLITHPCFSHCRAAFAQHRGPFCSSPCPTSKQAEDVRGAVRGHSQDGRAKLTPGISHTTILHHYNKNREEGGGRRDIWRSGNSHCEETALQEMTEHLPADRKQRMNSLLLLHMAFFTY